MKRQVVVSALEWRGWWEDDVGVASRLVDVKIDRRHKVEAGQGSTQLTSVGRGEHGVSAVGHQGLNLTGAFRQYLFGQRSYGQLAGKLRQLAHAAVPAAKAPARRDRLRSRHWIKRRQGKHGAALAIQVAGDSIQDVNQPLAQAAKLL